jgi:hypothetical protein
LQVSRNPVAKRDIGIDRPRDSIIHLWFVGVPHLAPGLDRRVIVPAVGSMGVAMKVAALLEE